MVTLIAAVDLSALDLLLAALLILANAAVSIALRLDLGGQILFAALRATIQLAVLGTALTWVFGTEGPWIVVPWMLAMGTVAGIEAVRRTRKRVRGAYLASISIMVASSMLVTIYGTTVVIDTEGPWYAPAYAIPLVGMILGNTLNGISLGLEAAFEGFAADRERVEMLLAHGASRREASIDVIRRSVRRGLVPILNSMVAVGLISIPGMMTGQILAGESPDVAARYQLFILFAIAGGVAIGTVGVVLAAERLVFDERDRLRVDRIKDA